MCSTYMYIHTYKQTEVHKVIHTLVSVCHVSTIVNAVQFKHSAHTLHYTYIRRQVH